MSATRENAWPAVLALGLVATTPADAWAYVDPGTGSYLFQLAAAGFLAGMFTLRRYWDVVKSRFGRQTTSARADRSADQSE
jgi:hypothetical protein